MLTDDQSKTISSELRTITDGRYIGTIRRFSRGLIVVDVLEQKRHGEPYERVDVLTSPEDFPAFLTHIGYTQRLLWVKDDSPKPEAPKPNPEVFPIFADAQARARDVFTRSHGKLRAETVHASVGRGYLVKVYLDGAYLKHIGPADDLPALIDRTISSLPPPQPAPDPETSPFVTRSEAETAAGYVAEKTDGRLQTLVVGYNNPKYVIDVYENTTYIGSAATRANLRKLLLAHPPKGETDA